MKLEWKTDLEDCRGRSDGRVGALNATGVVTRESGLDELPLELVGRRSRGLEFALVLLRAPLASFALQDEGEHSHCESKTLNASQS